ncbi:ABC transporter substrate-binding protein [Devosia sp. XJ19-1]|uniref:ABC transporter substrate-binding protein n=1 Tax=Devosia ureilytica TaxID=2952754 RepID=A0A9Q4AS60_9HYPH|nr:ABC transporter substrate-binding protein [Devosia ureilytica]MCP8885333.1 ABC transporter substrate-binding protein [Devosia ureilytica]MCP8888791.1 ABC transporter substrate-binding protein [Devosia ureilytica]
MPMLLKMLCAPLVLIGLLTTPALAQSDAPFRLIVTHLEPPLVPNSVMDLAVSLGYFAREGVNVELVRVQQTPSALAALQSGDGEMANVGVDALLQAIAAGASDLRAVASPNKSLPFLIAAQNAIGSVDELAGARFGVGRVGSLDHSLSGLVLETLGADIEATQLVALGQPNVRAQALMAGQIDATTMSIGTWISLPETDTLHVLVDQDAYYAAAPLINKVNAVPGAVLRERPDDVAAVLRALIRISRDFAADPDLWVNAMAAALPDTDRGVLENLAPDFASSWSVNGGMSAAALGYTASWLYGTADFAGSAMPPLESWVDFGPVDAALASLGVTQNQDPADR